MQESQESQERQERQEKAQSMRSVIESVIQTRFKLEGGAYAIRKNGIYTSVYFGSATLIVAILSLANYSVVANYNVMYKDIDAVRIHDDIIDILLGNSCCSSIALFV